MINSLTGIWKFFSPFLRSYKNQLIILLMLPIVWCLVETTAPYLIKIMIDDLAVADLSRRAQGNSLTHLMFAYIFLVLILELSTRTCNYLWIKTFPYIKANMQNKILELIQVQSFSFIYNQLSGDLINKYRNLTESFEQIFKILLYGFYPTILSFFFSIIFIARISKIFATVFLFWFLSMNLVTFLFFEKNMIASKEKSKNQDHLVGYVGNFICNAITMLAFPRELSVESEFGRLVQKSIASTEKLELVTFKADIFRSLASWILLSSMIVFLGFGWQKSWITLGDFSFIGAVCFYIRRSIWMSAFQLSEFIKELGVVQEALSLIDGMQVGHKDAAIREPKIPHILKASIDFHHIQFGYSKDKILFNNLNLHIPAGQKLGISGNSGAGKTSLMQLLLRFYDPIQGVITLNGQDYREFNVKNLRDFFSYVPQNVSLLHRSIFDNIAFGKPGASKDEIYEAAHVCLCDEFVPSLDMGYDTIIGEGGYKISGGQRQRVALARAYIKKSPIFLLDEALSGLDPDLEDRLLDHLCRELQSHTIISISHRASALTKMDRLIKFNQGQIIIDDCPPKIIEQENIWQKEQEVI
jgi:ATP-binding cassette subfamily B protein